jgi:hypothetical protein
MTKVVALMSMSLDGYVADATECGCKGRVAGTYQSAKCVSVGCSCLRP